MILSVDLYVLICKPEGSTKFSSDINALSDGCQPMNS